MSIQTIGRSAVMLPKKVVQRIKKYPARRIALVAVLGLAVVGGSVSFAVLQQPAQELADAEATSQPAPKVESAHAGAPPADAPAVEEATDPAPPKAPVSSPKANAGAPAPDTKPASMSALEWMKQRRAQEPPAPPMQYMKVIFPEAPTIIWDGIGSPWGGGVVSVPFTVERINGHTGTVTAHLNGELSGGPCYMTVAKIAMIDDNRGLMEFRINSSQTAINCQISVAVVGNGLAIGNTTVYSVKP